MYRGPVEGPLVAGWEIHSMASKTPTWVWVVFGVIGFFILLCIAVVGGGIFMFRQHVHTEAVPKQTALQEFDRQRSRFAGQQPLVQVAKDQRQQGRRPSAVRDCSTARRPAGNPGADLRRAQRSNRHCRRTDLARALGPQESRRVQPRPRVIRERLRRTRVGRSHLRGH